MGAAAVGAALLLPTALSARADTALTGSASTSTTTLSMGTVTTSGQTVQLAPMTMERPANAPPTNPPCDADHGMPLIHSEVCETPRPGDKEDNHHHCDGDGDADDMMHCPSGSPSSTPSGQPSGTPTSSGTPSSTASPSEDVCENGGIFGETIADQLVDAGVPLNEPEDNGPISAPLQSALSPLDPIAAEVTCIVSLLGL
jgi:hypothetical protein